jgi:hypothetical protein
MATVIVRHKVEDYTRWKRGYDDADWLRKQHGITYASVHREKTIPNIFIQYNFRSLDLVTR